MDTFAHGLWAGAAFIAARRTFGAALRLHWALSWGQRWFMVLNYSAITAAFGALFIWFLVSRRRRVSGSTGPRPAETQAHPIISQPH